MCESGGRPVVAVVCDTLVEDGVRLQAARDRYCEALVASGAAPMLLPTTCPPDAVRDCLARVHGLLLTGASSDVHPTHYGLAGAAHSTYDMDRDRIAFAAIETGLSRQLPILGVCRGLQELNVYFGGTLVADLRAPRSAFERHHEDLSLPRDRQYDPVHRVSVTPGSALHAAVGEETIMVNSLHRQGVLALGRGLRAAGIAQDGLIEAVEAPGAPGFVLAVQWHPEWHFNADGPSGLIWQAFRRACSRFAAAEPVTEPSLDELGRGRPTRGNSK